jgi:peptide/nickel transport system ATP-binding protein
MLNTSSQGAADRASAARVRGQDLLRIQGLKIQAMRDDDWSDIVHGIDLTVKRGEVVGLIGESGAGKSSIGLAAMGYARAGCRISSGTVELIGKDLTKVSSRERRNFLGKNIAYVAQSAAAAFNPAHRLLRQIVEPQVWHGVARRDGAVSNAISLFRRLHLPEPETIGSRYPHEVSGGQLQRVMTAMAMSCGPDLIVFDEPTTALDVTTQIEVLVAIKDAVRRTNTAALYISHDLAVVAQLADRIVVLKHGRIVEEGPTHQIMNVPREAYTRSLWAVRALQSESRTSAETLLSIKNISASYGPVKVLDNVSIELSRGRTVAIVGESGSGKSTLARVVSGLLPPDSGAIRFDSQPLARSYKKRSVDMLRRIQMVYQTPDTALNPKRTVRDILSRPLHKHLGMRGDALEKRARELMNLIELDESILDRKSSLLSGGQKQRICIARAIALNPDVIICDEVTSSLDQLVAEGILKLLRRLQEEFGISYLFITHDISTVRAIADDMVVMHRGKVVQSGRKEDVLAGPHHPYTAKLLSSVPEMDPTWLDRMRPPETA